MFPAEFMKKSFRISRFEPATNNILVWKNRFAFVFCGETLERQKTVSLVFCSIIKKKIKDLVTQVLSSISEKFWHTNNYTIFLKRPNTRYVYVFSKVLRKFD